MKNSENISPKELQRLAESPAGQQLMQLLQSQHADAVASVQQAPDDLVRAKNALQSFLADPQAQALIRMLQEEHHG